MGENWLSIQDLLLMSMINKETTVVIPHSSSVETLIAVLIQLQMQTVAPVQIYIIDCSVTRTGLRTATKFSFNNVPISVECVKSGTIQENWNRGIILSRDDHPHASILIINDDVLLPLNAIELFQKAENDTHDLAYVPETPSREHESYKVETLFSPMSSSMVTSYATWMPGFVFYLTERCINEVGLFDEQFKVWWGDTDYERRILKKGHIALINGLYVYHYGGRSYQYLSREVRDKIDIDRLSFRKKYNE